MKTEREKIYKVSKNQYLDRVFHEFKKLPSNAIINKGRCGIGGTRLEIETPRDSIIVVPTISIINSKCKNIDGEVISTYKTNPKIFGVMGKINKAKLVSMFKDKHPVKKIFTTPAGLRKLMECGYSQELIRENWFLLLDECHTAITDSFRNDILIPFDYFWDFPKENRAMISATPYEFSDPRFREMDTHTIKIKEKLGKIVIINSENIQNSLHYILQNPDELKGNIHIFLNSVSEIVRIARLGQIQGYLYSIYVADNEPNMAKLDELGINYFPQPTLENVSRVNFYTSRYFEGWDLMDRNPTIILVTDISINTTKLGIRNKAFQAIGRARTSPSQIIQITNHRNIKELLPIDEIERLNEEKAKSVIENYNNHLADSISNKFNTDLQLKDVCKKYATFDDNSLAHYNSYLIDQSINQDRCDQDYNHIDYINNAWLEMNYETENVEFDPPNIPANFKKASRTNKIRFIVNNIERIENNRYNYLIDKKSKMNKFFTSVDAAEWISAYHILGKEKIEEVEYSPTAIKKLLIEDHNSKMEPQKSQMVRDAFLQGIYTIDEVKTELYSINQKLGIKDVKDITGKTYKPVKKDELYKYFKIRSDKSNKDQSQYEAEFGKYTFSINWKSVRKEGFKVY